MTDEPLQISVGIDNESKQIIMNFSKQILWASFEPHEAISFGEMMINKGKMMLEDNSGINDNKENKTE